MRKKEKKLGKQNKILKKVPTVDEVKTEIINKIVTEINELLDDQSEGGDSTYSMITLFEETFQPVLD